MYNFEGVKSEVPHTQEILLYYKTNPCHSGQKNAGELSTINQNCNQMFCFNYHSPNERRRPVLSEDSPNMAYQPIKCPALMENLPCSQGEFCKFAHNQMEIIYHPLCYKTEPCPGCFFENNSKFCPYFHPDEISRKITLEKFKAKLNKEALKGQQALSPAGQTIFNLDNFKLKPCPLKGNHNPKMCEFYHHDQDRKRPVGIFHYSPNLCPFNTDDKSCPNGDNCRYAHNKVEQLYHPERYKKKFCLTHPHNVYKCDYGNYCSFAHSENEIQVELLHNLKKDENFYLYKYKTVFCPYIYEHDRNQCVYAHNPQDFRRDPQKFTYDPIQCSYWSQGQIFSYEEGGCPKHMQCEHCHGWKEMEYHPMYYKTKPCNNGKKCNKKDCPFYHMNTERRDIQPGHQLAQNVFSNQGQTTNLTNLMAPQKAATAFLENDYTLNFDIPKSKFVKPKESHYTRPVMPIIPNYPLGPNFNQQLEIFQTKPKRSGEPSTRPNSNISAAQFLPSEENYFPQERVKKKKIKGMSLQAKMDKSSSPLSAKSDKPKGQLFGKHQGKFSHQEWKPMDPEAQNVFNEFFFAVEPSQPFSESKANESFESLQSYTVEKNVASDKPSETANAQFLKKLYSQLEKKGLDNAIQCFKNLNVEVEVLKSFSQKCFDQFPQISTEDKEKIAKIVQDLEEDALFSEINTINDPMGSLSLAQQNTEEINIFTNPENEDNNSFNASSFFQKYSH